MFPVLRFALPFAVISTFGFAQTTSPPADGKASAAAPAVSSATTVEASAVPTSKDSSPPGLADDLGREFAPPPQLLADALTFCDMTTSPDGKHVHVTRRLAEIHDRYGSGHLVSRSIRRATPLILQAVDHVHARNL